MYLKTTNTILHLHSCLTMYNILNKIKIRLYLLYLSIVVSSYYLIFIMGILINTLIHWFQSIHYALKFKFMSYFSVNDSVFVTDSGTCF